MQWIDGRDWLICSVVPGNGISVGFAGVMGVAVWQKDHIQASLVFFYKSHVLAGALLQAKFGPVPF